MGSWYPPFLAGPGVSCSPYVLAQGGACHQTGSERTVRADRIYLGGRSNSDSSDSVEYLCAFVEYSDLLYSFSSSTGHTHICPADAGIWRGLAHKNTRTVY
ncbi:hypothetical protein K474DRAFT_1178980 [Panus rudis PR-1116 ss-1]|nr:hypothetical protein K474DRAFT_1178980 [Panus rudis PR-1116 ss-1]